MNRKKVVFGLVLVLFLVVIIVGASQKMEEIKQQKQWSGQMVLFAMKAVELLEPIVEVDNYDDFFAYFESEEVSKQINDLQRLRNIKKEFAENTRAVYVRYGPDTMGQRELDEWKINIKFRDENRNLSEEDKEKIVTIALIHAKSEYEYFIELIEDIMAGKTSLKVPSQKDIEMAQKSLDESGV